MGDGYPGVAPAVQRDGREGVVAPAGGMAGEVRRDGFQDGTGLLLPARLAELDGGGAVGVVAWDGVAAEVAGIGLQAEHWMQATLGAGVVATLEDIGVASEAPAEERRRRETLNAWVNR